MLQEAEPAPPTAGRSSTSGSKCCLCFGGVRTTEDAKRLNDLSVVCKTQFLPVKAK